MIIDDKEKDLHLWQQPKKGVITLLNIFSKPNDLVLDTFAGSGTVLECCKELKRKSIGIEINKEMVEVIKGRLIDNKE